MGFGAQVKSPELILIAVAPHAAPPVLFLPSPLTTSSPPSSCSARCLPGVGVALKRMGNQKLC